MSLLALNIKEMFRFRYRWVWTNIYGLDVTMLFTLRVGF